MWPLVLGPWLLPFSSLWLRFFVSLLVLVVMLVWRVEKARDMVFMMAAPTLAGSPWLGEMLGVKYVRSDEYSTSRGESYLPMQTMAEIMGMHYRINSKPHIKELKMRQRRVLETFEVLESLEPLAGQEMTLEELELKLVDIWTRQMVRCYGFPEPNYREIGPQIVTLRKFLALFLSSTLASFYLAITNFSHFSQLYKYFNSLDTTCSEEILFIVPMLTTVDSTILALLDPEEIREFHEIFRHTPLSWMPMAGSGGYRIMRLENNKLNNPSNSVFGSKGFVCPGSQVSFEVLRALQRAKERVRLNVVSEVKPIIVDRGVVKVVSNMGKVRVRIQLKDKIL